MESKNMVKKSRPAALIIVAGVVVSLIALFQEPLFRALKLFLTHC